jgi:hypothetical protein
LWRRAASLHDEGEEGNFLSPDPAFKGKPRAAADHAYALKRIMDPAVQSPWLWMLEARSWVSTTCARRRRRRASLIYDAPVAGITLIDRHTFRIRLNAAPAFSLRPGRSQHRGHGTRRGEAYGNDIGAHPVGTGPYIFGQHKRSSRIELLAKPGFREVTYTPAGPIPASSEAVAANLKGKRLPRLPRIDVSIMEERPGALARVPQRRSRLPEPAAGEPDRPGARQRQAETRPRGQRRRAPAAGAPSRLLHLFQHGRPDCRGYEPARIALRRAMGMAYNNDEAIRVLLSGRALPASGPIPPDIAGWQPETQDLGAVVRSRSGQGAARKVRLQGPRWRRLPRNPGGKPLVVERWSPPTTIARERDELWGRTWT